MFLAGPNLEVNQGYKVPWVMSLASWRPPYVRTLNVCVEAPSSLSVDASLSDGRWPAPVRPRTAYDRSALQRWVCRSCSQARAAWGFICAGRSGKVLKSRGGTFHSLAPVAPSSRHRTDGWADVRWAGLAGWPVCLAWRRRRRVYELVLAWRFG
jgi:hypothetical protein